MSTQLVLLALCVARVATDLRRGPLTIEADIALAFVIVLTVSLVAKAIAWAIRVGLPDSDGIEVIRHLRE